MSYDETSGTGEGGEGGDPGGGEAPAYDWRQDPNVPTAESQGYTLGSDPCLDACWDAYYKCLDRGRDPSVCLGDLTACQRGCAERPAPDAGTPAAQPCDQGPCPNCASEFQDSQPCNQALGHGGPHTCVRGHTW